MSIHTLAQKIKTSIEGSRKSLISTGIIAITAIASFYLGFIARSETLILTSGRANLVDSTQVTINAKKDDLSVHIPQAKSSGTFVASKNGTKYYQSSCPSASRIKDANKVYFDSEEEAVADGYSKASGC